MLCPWWGFRFKGEVVPGDGVNDSFLKHVVVYVFILTERVFVGSDSILSYTFLSERWSRPSLMY